VEPHAQRVRFTYYIADGLLQKNGNAMDCQSYNEVVDYFDRHKMRLNKNAVPINGELRKWQPSDACLLSPSSFGGISKTVSELRSKNRSAFSTYIFNLLSPATQQALTASGDDLFDEPSLKRLLTDDFNKLITSGCLLSSPFHDGIRIRPLTKMLLASGREDATMVSRLMLEDAYQDIEKIWED
jgi:hypothetical protein